MTTKFGWCLDGHHTAVDPMFACPGKNGTLICSCPCHDEESNDDGN